MEMGGACGGRGLLWRANGRAGVNRKLLVYGNGKFLRTAKKGLCNRKALAQKGSF